MIVWLRKMYWMGLPMNIAFAKIGHKIRTTDGSTKTKYLNMFEEFSRGCMYNLDGHCMSTKDTTFKCRPFGCPYGR